MATGDKTIIASQDYVETRFSDEGLPDKAVGTQQEGGVGELVLNIVKVTQAEFDLLTPVGTSMYLIVG